MSWQRQRAIIAIVDRRTALKDEIRRINLKGVRNDAVLIDIYGRRNDLKSILDHLREHSDVASAIVRIHKLIRAIPGIGLTEAHDKRRIGELTRIINILLGQDG